MAKKSKRADDRSKLLTPLRVTDTNGAGNGLLPDVPELCEAFPVLNAMLTVTSIEGVKRQPATLTLWVEDHGIRAVLSDRSAKRKMWATAPSLGGLYGELEASLTHPQPKWMDDTGTRRK